MRHLLVALGAAAALVVAGWCAYRLWPRSIAPQSPAPTAAYQRVGKRDIVTMPGRHLFAEIATYGDELFAYMMFQYFRGARAMSGWEVLLTYRKTPRGLVYPIEIKVDNDLIASIDALARLQRSGLIRQFDWRFVDESTLLRFRYQTGVFRTAYSLNNARKLEDMSRAELVSYIRRFVRFKSVVDPRIRRKIEPIPRPLTSSEARRLADDIVAVAEFYSLPLDFFLGIGAMENNYMNVKGDLEHAVWKKRPHRGDMIVKRRPGAVLVLNPASGVWQITRETLRYVHNLYLKDTRDYSRLPQHLRPPQQLNLDEPDPAVLTTYAGLLFRRLLDRFNGDVSTAVGAYNGGPGNPNARYEEGVRMVAQYARRMIQQAAVLHGDAAAGMRFLRAR